MDSYAVTRGVAERHFEGNTEPPTAHLDEVHGAAPRPEPLHLSFAASGAPGLPAVGLDDDLVLETDTAALDSTPRGDVVSLEAESDHGMWSDDESDRGLSPTTAHGAPFPSKAAESTTSWAHSSAGVGVAGDMW